MVWFSWKQDREKLSNEPHEVAYAKKLARNFLVDFEEYDGRDKVFVRVSKLRRICQFVLKK